MLISLVVPVFNEESTIPLFLSEINNNGLLADYSLEIIFINDGSTDNTEQIITAEAMKSSNIVAVNFSRNFGKESALLAGIFQSTGDAVIPIDVDLQDPIDVIPMMIERWQEGFDVVLAKRADRSSDSFFKRATSKLFYMVYNNVVENKIEGNVGDFRLMSRRAIEAVKELPENNLFMKGLLSWVGFPTTVIEYTRVERAAGKTKFKFLKLFNLALDGVTSFSNVPLRFWSCLGGTVAFISFLFAMKIVLSKLILGNPVPGYSSLMVAILFLGGVQLIGIGVLGEYIGRIYKEAKHRPRYIIKSIIDKNRE
ncbi:glycosyltransferase [Entomomonas moraniae]|uniref:Glycosyltransferase n=1 Tax=Entomomonas moraniae TaxID=2213226 RepID=A0A3Q9JHU1_9GAMM|nr:glycosyltransferase family 2 protein [Entomomonas moraniae]AZS49790.1 glycosyltransferase [Entomomonas moraniae]